jgi:hypothetical protein
MGIVESGEGTQGCERLAGHVHLLSLASEAALMYSRHTESESQPSRRVTFPGVASFLFSTRQRPCHISRTPRQISSSDAGDALT